MKQRSALQEDLWVLLFNFNLINLNIILITFRTKLVSFYILLFALNFLKGVHLVCDSN